MTWKKRIITIALSSALLALVLVGCRQETSSDDSEEPASDPDDGMTAAAELIADIPTTQAFTDDEVPDEDIDKILSAGINAPSAINGQNWHFTAVTDDDVLQQIADSMGGGKPADPTSGSESGEQPDNTASAEDTAGEETDSGDAAPAESSTGTAKAGITDAPLAIEISCKEGSEFDAGLACPEYVGGGAAAGLRNKDHLLSHDRPQRRGTGSLPRAARHPGRSERRCRPSHRQSGHLFGCRRRERRNDPQGYGRGGDKGLRVRAYRSKKCSRKESVP